MLCLNDAMFARKIRAEYMDHGHAITCPVKWLDSFSMRNFTNASVFDDTVPVSDGLMEIGTNATSGETARSDGGLVPAQELSA
jgi:hypothetical protein